MRRIVPISRFVSDSVFQVKTGGYGSMFRVQGTDDETMTPEALVAVSQRLERAFKKLDPQVVVYQYLVKRRGCPVVHKSSYPTAAIQASAEDRVKMLETKADLGRIELAICLLSQSDVKAKVQPEQLRAANVMARQILTGAIATFEAQLSELLGLRLMDKQEVYGFFAYILNPQRLPEEIPPLKRDDAVDYQLVGSSLDWKADHLTFNTKRFAQMFSLKELPSSSAPNLWGDLLKLDVDMVLRSEWQRKTTPETRKHQSKIRQFHSGIKGLDFAKAATASISDKDTAKKILTPDKASEKVVERLDQVLVSIEADGGYFGYFSLFGMLHGESQEAISSVLPRVHRIFAEQEASILEEGLGGLSAYYSLFPGNRKFNVRTQWTEGSTYADLSFVFAPNIGHQESQSLRDEYLAVYETRDGSPYYFDPYHGGVRGMLVLGPPRAGKSMEGNFLVANEQKYGGFTYIFDIGGSYEDNVRQHNGTIVRVGADGPKINPFSLEPTTDNLHFLKGFVEMLLEKSGAKLTPQDEQLVFSKLRQVYQLGANRRRLSSLYNTLPPNLKPFLEKWINPEGYGRIFDNAMDELELTRLQVFEFQDVGREHADIMEPILFWIIRRIETVAHAPENRGISKSLWFDEVWKHLENPTLLSLIITSLKTGGKHLMGTTLLTQSAQDLGKHADLITNTCPMQLFLADDKFNRELYADLFRLDARKLELIAGLQRPREAYLNTPDSKTCKVLVLNLGAKEYWRYTTEPNERKERAAAIALYGPERAFEVLASRAG